MRTKYKIIVKTLQDRILTFTVSSYTTKDGFVTFTDERTGDTKTFDGRNVEINEVSCNGGN